MNIVKIRRIDAYRVEIERTAEEFMLNNYGHILYKVDGIWLNIGYDIDAVVIHNTNDIKKLNKAFEETNSLIHEQLDLL